MVLFRHDRSTLWLVLPLLVAGCGGGDFFSTGSTDKSPPLGVLSAPAALTTLTGSIQLAASASDDVGVTGVDFQVDGATVATVTAAPYTAGLDTTRWAYGQHVVRVRARDAAGNASAWSSATVQFGGTQAF